MRLASTLAPPFAGFAELAIDEPQVRADVELELLAQLRPLALGDGKGFQQPARAPEHARHFVGLVEQVLRDAGARQQATPIVCSMYDTELFGHWWFEGPLFLAAVIDRARAADFELTTAGAHLDRHPPAEAVALPEGSWGDGGQHQVWLLPG